MTNFTESTRILTNQFIDSKGRNIGFVVGFCEDLDTGTHYAWVQKYQVTDNGDWKAIGAVQSSRQFKTQALAVQWAYNAAKERGQKAKAKH